MTASSLLESPTNQHQLSNGRDIGLPIKYRNSTGVVAHFPAPAKKIRELLPSENLVPVSFMPGVAVLSIAALEYREVSDFEPYNEVSIMVPVQYRPSINLPGLPLLFHNHFKTFGFYVLHLPVDTQQSMDLGIELWGFPKFVADIEFVDDEKTRACRLNVRDELILELKVKKRKVKRTAKCYHTFTIFDKKLVRTKIETTEDSFTRRMMGGVELQLGDHPIARQLSDLNFRPRAIEYSYASTADSLLFPFDQQFDL